MGVRPGWKAFLVSLGCLLSLRLPLTADPTILDPRHAIERFKSIDGLGGKRIYGMTFGPGGDFGADLYVVDRTTVRIIKLLDQSMVTFVTIGADVGGPYAGYNVNLRGITFGKGGAFGNDIYILNSMEPPGLPQPRVEVGRVLRIDKDKNITVVAEVAKADPNPTDVPDGTADFNDLVFGPGAGGFPSNLFLTDGAFGGGGVADVYQVDSGGAASIFRFGPATRGAVGIDFAFGGGFGVAGLVVATLAGGNDDNGIVGELKSDSSLRIIEDAAAPDSELFDPCAVRQGPGGEFGDDLFVTDLNTDKIYKLNAFGILSPFAQGFLFDQSTGHRLLFSPDKNTLFVSDGSPDGAGGSGVLWRIIPLDREIDVGLDFDETFDLTPERRSVIYKVTSAAPAGDPLIITLDDLDDPAGADANALYFRWGSAPTVSAFDHSADERGRPNQRIVVPITRAQDFYILAAANVIDGGANRLRLHARLEPLALEKTNISRVGEGGSGALNATAFGAGFTPETQFSLEPSTAPDGCMVLAGAGCDPFPAEEGSVRLISTGRAEMAFNLSGACPGAYNLVARGTRTAALACVFQVLPAARGPELSVSTSGFRFYRCYGVGRFTVEYSNTGDEEMTAPLIKIMPPPGIELRLEGEDDYRAGEAQLLGTSPNGAAGKLPPGGAGRVGIVFRTKSGGSCMEGDGEFQVLRFLPDAGGILDWDSVELPPGIPPAGWPVVRSGLANVLGATWKQYHEKLAELATRLSHRGEFVPSVRNLLRFAVRQAYGRPSSAILGKLLEKDSRIPIVSRQLVAKDGQTVVTSAVTDREGSFVLDWLEGGKAYSLEAVGQDVGAQLYTVPAGGDVFNTILEAESSGNAPIPGCPGCDSSGLPAEPLPLPPELFTAERVPQKGISVIASSDPNKKEGSAGQGDDDDGAFLVSPSDEILYKVSFENQPTASGYARYVRIEDRLDGKLNWETVRFVDYQVGRIDAQGMKLDTVSDTRGLLSATVKSTTEQPFGADGTFLVTVTDLDDIHQRIIQVAFNGDFDTNTGIVTWTFDTLGYEDSSLGFLPRNNRDNPGGPRYQEGEAYVTFAVKTMEDLAEGETIENEASIQFDYSAPISTSSGITPNPVARFYKMPEAPSGASPSGGTAEVEPDSPLKWKGRRAETYDLYLWEDGGNRVLEKSGLTSPSYSRPGGFELGRRYLWQVVSKNRYLPDGEEGPVWMFQTRQRPFRRGDVDGSGETDIADPIAALFYLFAQTGAIRCEKALDANDDGAVNVTDPIYILSYLFRGGDAPPAPFGSCGLDFTEDSLLCRANSGCP